MVTKRVALFLVLLNTINIFSMDRAFQYVLDLSETNEKHDFWVSVPKHFMHKASQSSDLVKAQMLGDKSALSKRKEEANTQQEVVKTAVNVLAQELTKFHTIHTKYKDLDGARIGELTKLRGENIELRETFEDSKHEHGRNFRRLNYDEQRAKLKEFATDEVRLKREMDVATNSLLKAQNKYYKSNATYDRDLLCKAEDKFATARAAHNDARRLMEYLDLLYTGPCLKHNSFLQQV